MSKQNIAFHGHALLGKIAFDSLPQWEKDLIKPDMSSEGLKKPFLPAGIDSIAEKAGMMCRILDFIYYDECRPYAVLPDGRWIPHSPPDANTQSSVGSGCPMSRTAYLALIESLVNRMMTAVKGRDWEEVIRHGGALAHVVQEPFTPGHAFDNSLFHLLFPDPDPNRHLRLHHFFDAASDGFEPLPPLLLGANVQELAFRLLMEIERGIKEGAKLVGLVIQAAYQGQPEAVCKAILAAQSRQAVFVTACAWHTVMSIVFNRIEDNELKRLSEVGLTSLPPYFCHACQYVDMIPNRMVREGRKIPIHVWGGNGRDELIENGFGMGGHMGMKFFVNGDIFPRFRCRVGLPSRHTEGQTSNTNTRFFVEMDEAENLVYSEDMEYKARRLAEIQLEPGKPVTAIDVSIKKARTLILTAQSQSYKDADGIVKFDIPHVVVCEPTLAKE